MLDIVMAATSNDQAAMREDEVQYSRRRIVKSALALPFVSMMSTPSWGQGSAYPNREIHSISMFPAGSGADLFVRYYSRKLEHLARKPVVVENRIGAGGNIATEYVARSKPDGYTILIGPVSHIIAPARFLFKQLGYDPDKDLQSVALLLSSPFLLFVADNSPFKSVAELVEYLKNRGEEATYGSSTTSGQICSEVFKAQFGLKTTEVKYRSGIEGVNELTKNQLDFYFTDAGTTQAMVADGRLRPLMLSTARRWDTFPGLPSAAESGVTKLDLYPWFSMHVPAGTPSVTVDQLKSWIDQFAGSDETRKFIAAGAGSEPLLGDAKAVDELMAKERAKWAEYVRIAHIQPQ